MRGRWGEISIAHPGSRGEEMKFKKKLYIENGFSTKEICAIHFN
jgi:hypothetical protein